MLGPLPRLYSLLILATLLASGVGLGAWIGFHDETPVVVTTGIALGVALAGFTAWLLLHDFRHGTSTQHSTTQHPARVRRRP